MAVGLQSAMQCTSCRNVMDEGMCVESCPYGKYADSAGECQFCDEQCAGGCSGPVCQLACALLSFACSLDVSMSFNRANVFSLFISSLDIFIAV